MQIVIDIPKNYYRECVDKVKNGESKDYLTDWISKGILLPEGHDAGELLKAMNTWDKFGFNHTGCFVREPKDDFITYIHYENMVKAVRGTSTIIESDNSESEEEE